MSAPDPPAERPTREAARDHAEWWGALPDPVAVIEVPSHHILDANRALEAATGETRTALRGRAARELFVPAHAPALDRLLDAVGREEQGRDEMDLLAASGAPIPMDVTVTRAAAPDGTPVLLLALRDISRRRSAEDEIHALYREFALLHLVRERIGLERDPAAIGEHVLEALFKIMDRDVAAGVFLWDDSDNALHAVARRRLEPELLMALGGLAGPAEQAYQERRSHRVDDTATLPPALVAACTAAGIRGLLFLPLRSPGRVHGVLAICTHDTEPLSASDADLLAAVGAETGMVLETARLESELRQSETRYRAMIEESPLGILEIARDGEIIWINRSAAAILGRTTEDLVGADMRALYRYPEERERIFAELGDGSVIRDRAVELIGGDGESVFVSLTSRRVPARDGQPERFEDVIRDITEERQLQEQLLRTEKLASLGQMISGIAHELNNPLTGVLGYSQLLVESDIPDHLRADIEKISTDAMRCKRIIENLMRFARKEKPRRDVVQVNEELETVIELRRYQLSVANVQIETELASELPYTMADPHQLQQVFLNLLNNAADAMREHAGAGTLRISSAVHADRIRCSFADTGPGIPAETLARVFDPFFTTKEVGKGTGLGLSVSYGIVREHGGEILVESTVGVGTTFHVDVPIERILPPNTRQRRTTRRLRVGGRGARVLVVDDEPQVLAVTQRTLDDDGYRTQGATDADTALAALSGEEFEAVVTDLAMPNRDGRALHAAIAEAHPGLANRVILLTGGVIDEDTRAWLESHGLAHLAKPYRVRELRKLVRRVIDEV